MRLTSHPPPSPDGPRCKAVDPIAGQCQLIAPHANSPHMAQIDDAIMAWGKASVTVDRWPRHTLNTWFRAAPWRREFKPSAASES